MLWAELAPVAQTEHSLISLSWPTCRSCAAVDLQYQDLAVIGGICGVSLLLDPGCGWKSGKVVFLDLRS